MPANCIVQRSRVLNGCRFLPVSTLYMFVIFSVVDIRQATPNTGRFETGTVFLEAFPREGDRAATRHGHRRDACDLAGGSTTLGFSDDGHFDHH